MTDTGPQFDERSPAEGEDRHDELMTKFDRWEKELTAHWSSWQQDAKVAYDFVAGHQWEKEDISLMEEAGKVPVVFNLTAPTVDAVSGAEIQNRQQVQYFPRDVGDTGVADALTQGAEYVSDECNGDQEDSEAFRDCLTCGIGWTETHPEVDGENVTIMKERVDPLQMRVDPSSRKACFEDRRYLCRSIPMSRDAFEDFREEIGRPDAEGETTGLEAGKRLTVVDPRRRYTNGMLGTGEDDEVVVNEWQWWEKVPAYLTSMPGDEPGVTRIVSLDEEKFAQVRALAPNIAHTRTTKKVYHRAIVADGEILLEEPLRENAFRYNAITGKRDRNRGVYYGLVRAMIDPQKFTNKLYSEILHIIRTNAKGGMAVEEGAIADVENFEATWAQADQITWFTDGALSSANGPRMIQKTPPIVPPQMFQLMEFARDMVQRTTGVSEELLGLVGREQAGVLEFQRKQQAYGILSPFFDAERRYRRDQGRLLLAMMRLYLPEDKLVRIVDQGSVKYVPLAYTLEAEEYDIVVDEAPSGPNQKAKVQAVLGPLLQPMFEADLIGADEIADMLPFMDLPAAVADKLAEGIKKRAAAAAQQGQDPEAAQIQKAAVMADIENTNADTEKKKADAFSTATDAHVKHAELGAAFVAEPETPEIL